MIRPAGDTDDDLSPEEDNNEDGTIVMKDDPYFVLSTTKGLCIFLLFNLEIYPRYFNIYILNHRSSCWERTFGWLYCQEKRNVSSTGKIFPKSTIWYFIVYYPF